MSTLKWKLFGIAIAFPVTVAAAGPNLGQPLSHADLAAWDINVLPDGSGLPKGSGTAAQGATIYAQKCAACHGEQGKGGISAAAGGSQICREKWWPAARGGGGGGPPRPAPAAPPPMKDMSSPKTIANFWPYSTTLFDFIRRAMPFTQPRSLSDEE